MPSSAASGAATIGLPAGGAAFGTGAGSAAAWPEPGEFPAVGPRSPCPCGSGRRYKACHGVRRRPAPVLRPFAGRVDEPDLVALRELVPSATAPLTLAAGHLQEHPEHAGRSIMLGTMLPQAVPALVRDNGEILLAMQTGIASDDAGADIARALLEALDADPGTPVIPRPAAAGSARGDGSRAAPTLADLLDPAPLDITVHSGFTWWLPPSEDGGSPDPQVVALLERANAAVVPTARLTSVDAAYWCRPGERAHLRWVQPYDEEPLLDALTRLAAANSLTVGDGSRFVGSLRVDGLVVPVWDLAPDADAASCEEAAATLRDQLENAIANRTPLTPLERRVRAGVVGRTLTLR
ncbi:MULTISPECIES: DUF5926 family protein [Protofrankia]|uniref:Preprotein translocase subunit SecA n=1 Tax=Protofrankia coriariae TaxID=1562887 RepID=A0ABR5F192_9ACTN|nr:MULTISPECIES: DUF5926 family protein [Protofrankia]KLL10487.1 preprotein translocase subunit SecA [Protofrankia coriariae]